MSEFLEIVSTVLLILLIVTYLGLGFYLRFVLKIKKVSSLSNIHALRKSKFFLLWLVLLLVLLVLIVLSILNKIDQGFLMIYVFGLNVVDMLILLYKAKH